MKATDRRMRDQVRREKIGLRLKLLREALGYRQGEWVKRYKLRHASTLANWESGLRFPDIEFLIALCEDHPGITLDWLLRGKPRKFPVSGPAERSRVADG
jgi:transcriptional regulator with XRE-family HTH domain